MSDTDLELLTRYTRHRAEEAFAEIVRRHLGLVHSAALRQVRSPPLAEEVAQTVFTELARNAARLKPDTIMPAWLYEVTRRTAINVVRGELRRQLREQIATEMNAMNATAADWTHIEPLLDEAMHALDETDRAAVLLRYFENKSLREVGQTLGASEDAAQKRLTRAVERLREFFAKRGVTVGASGLVVFISANAIQAAPVALALTISTAAALTGTTIASATMNILNLKSLAVIIGAAIAAGTGTYLVQQRAADRLHNDNQKLLVAQEKLANERDSALNAATASHDELERLRKDQTELLRLRGEVGRLRQQLQQLQVQKSQAALPAKRVNPVEANALPPGAYITKEQLAHVGYATPEAALQTITWAMMNANYEQVSEGLSPDMLMDESKDAKAREGFEARQKMMAPLFKGMQILARKALPDDKVELKMRMDSDPIPGQQRAMPPFYIQPMRKIGDTWKLGGSTRAHQAAWDKDGEIQTFAQ